MEKIVSIVKDFHPYPAGRYVADGAGNGTTFREKFLEPLIREGRVVVVDLDGAPGYPSSFLEEAFGGLVRDRIAVRTIRDLLKFKAETPGYGRYVDKIWAHIDRAERQSLAS